MKSALLLLLASILSMAGTWSGKWEVPAEAGDQPHYMVLQQQGETVKGTAGPDAGQQFDISNGKVTAEKLTFDVTLPDGHVMHFDFKIDGETLTGQAVIDADGRTMTVKLSAKRVKP